MPKIEEMDLDNLADIGRICIAPEDLANARAETLRAFLMMHAKPGEKYRLIVSTDRRPASNIVAEEMTLIPLAEIEAADHEGQSHTWKGYPRLSMRTVFTAQAD